MLVSDFIKECESYTHSREHFEIMEECYKIDLMDTYLKSREYISENLSIVDSFGDNYFMESKNNDVIKSESQKNKENVIVRLIKFIIDKFKKFCSTMKTIWDNIWKDEEPLLSTINMSSLPSSTHAKKNIKIDTKNIDKIRSITNKVSNEVGGFITGNNDKLAIGIKSSDPEKEDIDSDNKEADRDINNSARAAYSEIILVKLDHPIDFIPLTEPDRFVNIRKLFKSIDKGLTVKDKNCIYDVLKEPGTIKEIKISFNKDNCNNLINFIGKMTFELEKKLKSDTFTIDSSLMADLNKAVSLIIKSSGSTINLITSIMKYRVNIRKACMN